jgi:hypothetical protein
MERDRHSLTVLMETRTMQAIAGSEEHTMARAKKVPLYVDMKEDLKRRMDRLAAHRRRKLTGEMELAVERYLAEEEPKEPHLPPLEEQPIPRRRKRKEN